MLWCWLVPIILTGTCYYFSISFPQCLYNIGLYLSVVLLPSTVLFHGLLSTLQSLFFPCVFTSFAPWIFLLCHCSCEASFQPPTQMPLCCCKTSFFLIFCSAEEKDSGFLWDFHHSRPLLFSLSYCAHHQRGSNTHVMNKGHSNPTMLKYCAVAPLPPREHLLVVVILASHELISFSI